MEAPVLLTAAFSNDAAFIILENLGSAPAPCSSSDADLVTVKTSGKCRSKPAEGDTVTYTHYRNKQWARYGNQCHLWRYPANGINPTVGNGTACREPILQPTWTIGTLANGASATLTLEGTVDVGQDGNTITNTTTPASTPDQNDPTIAGDDLFTESVTVNGCVDTDGDGPVILWSRPCRSLCRWWNNRRWRYPTQSGKLPIAIYDGATNGDEITDGIDPYDLCGDFVLASQSCGSICGLVGRRLWRATVYQWWWSCWWYRPNRSRWIL